MSESNYLRSSTKTIGDMAVDGLFAGAVGGVAMAGYLTITALFNGEIPGSIMARFTPSGDGSPIVGTITHLAVSAIYGAVFTLMIGLLRKVRPSAVRFSWLLGVIYGLVLWLTAEFVILPAADSPLQQIPSIHFVLAHLVYGLALGLIVERSNR